MHFPGSVKYLNLVYNIWEPFVGASCGSRLPKGLNFSSAGGIHDDVGSC